MHTLYLDLHCKSTSSQRVNAYARIKESTNFTSRSRFGVYEGGSICNENLYITPSINALGFYAICQTKDQSVAVKMVYETLFYLSKLNKLQTF